MPTPIDVESLGTRDIKYVKTVSQTNPGTGMRTLVPKLMTRQEAQPILTAEEAEHLKDFAWTPTSPGLLQQGVPPFMVKVNGRRFFADAIPVGGNPSAQPETTETPPAKPGYDLPGSIDPRVTPLIIAAGYDSADKVLGAGRDKLVEIKGIGPATAGTLIDLCSDHVARTPTDG